MIMIMTMTIHTYLIVHSVLLPAKRGFSTMTMTMMMMINAKIGVGSNDVNAYQ